MVTPFPLVAYKVAQLPNGSDPNAILFKRSPGEAMATQFVATATGAELIPVTTYAYVHQQPTPATEWVINHNLGLRPIVKCYTTGGVEFEAEVIHISVNQARARMAAATAGQARCI